MVNRKLLEVISRLGESEQKQLRLYLASPYFTQGMPAQRLLELYDYIVEYGADENHPALDKKRVAELFYPDKPFRDKEKGPIDVLTSKLFTLVRSFLHQRAGEKKLTEAKELLTLARFYLKHSLEERFLQTIQALQKAQAGVGARDADYYLMQFQVHNEILSFKTLFSSYEDEFNVGATHQHLDTYYTMLKLELLCVSLYEERVSQAGEPIDSPYKEAALSLPIDHPLMAFPLSPGYRMAYNLLLDPNNETEFQAFETLLREHKTAFVAEQYYDLLALYRYFWIARYRKQGADVTAKLFELYQEQLRDGSLYRDNRLHTTVMRGIIQFGLRTHAYDWVKNFLDEHPPERIEGTRYPTEFYFLNYAEYHFVRGEYDQALDRLNFISFENTVLSLQVDLLLVRIYYETQDDLLVPRMKALEQRLRRSRVAKETKEGYFNFLKKLDKVIRYGWDRKNPKRAKLVEEIKTAPLVFHREWLLEKLK